MDADKKRRMAEEYMRQKDEEFQRNKERETQRQKESATRKPKPTEKEKEQKRSEVKKASASERDVRVMMNEMMLEKIRKLTTQIENDVRLEFVRNSASIKEEAIKRILERKAEEAKREEARREEARRETARREEARREEARREEAKREQARSEKEKRRKEEEEKFYIILEISVNASKDEIRKAYRKLALKHHPDKNMDKMREAEKIFKEIANAYEFLMSKSC